MKDQATKIYNRQLNRISYALGSAAWYIHHVDLIPHTLRTVMKFRKSVVLIALCCVGLTAFAQVTTQLSTEHKTVPATSVADSSKTSLDWSGTYTGTLPCASCSGISTELTLEKNGNYQLRSDYLGEEDGKFTETGTFQWNLAGNKIVLSNGQRFLVGENQLFMLNSDGNRVQGPLAEAYTLKKPPSA